MCNTVRVSKVYVLTETTKDDGWYIDEILGIFETETEAESFKEKIENNEGYNLGNHRWLSVDEYILGKFLKPHIIN